MNCICNFFLNNLNPMLFDKEQAQYKCKALLQNLSTHCFKCAIPENWSEGQKKEKKERGKQLLPLFPPLSHTRRIGGLLSAMRLPLVSQETVWGLLGSPPIPQDWAQLQGVNKIISQPFSLTPHVLSGQLVAHPMWLDCLHNMFHAHINFIHTHYRLKMENEVLLDLAASPSHSI